LQAKVLKPDFKDNPPSALKVADEQSAFMNGPFSERKLK
jgi:hypothetical protein